MASEKARLAKDKGNAAFKSGDFPAAVGHYTDAIIADSTDHTFFLNRAAAYLKLGKAEDTERDCTKVLALSPINVKAHFRRAQARRALGSLDGAREDLDTALALEPANEAVKNEILELEKLSDQRESRQRSKYIAVDTPNATAPKRRRVPIEVVEADSGPSSSPQGANREDLLQPLSSRSLKKEGKPTATQAPPPKPQTFVDAKQARETARPFRVSGGIFRQSGNHTLITRTPSGTPPGQESTSRPAHDDASIPRPSDPPTTLFQFTKSWESLQSEKDKWDLIRTVPPSSIPALFQVSLEPELLQSILHTFQAVLEQDSSPDTQDSVRCYLLAFTKVQRFGTVMLFMDKPERQLFERLHKRVNP